MYKLFEVILVTGLSSLFVTGALKMFVWDQFFNDKPYYLKGCDVLKKIVIVETILSFVVGLGGLLVLALIG